MPDNAKFSNFVSGGDIQGGDTLVGLRAGVNTKFLYAGPDGPEVESPTVASLIALSGAGIVCRIGIASFRLRTLQGHDNQINVFGGTGEFTDPLLSLSSTLDAPGTFTIQGTVAVDSIIDDDSFLTASDTNIPTAASVKAYVDSAGSGGVHSVKVFTSTGTWTRPSGVSFIKVAMVGGGGGSGGLGATCGGPHRAISSGGGGGEYACSVLDVSGFSSATVVVGSGGNAGCSGEHSGSDGGDTSFNGLVIASGGCGGSSLEMAWSSFSIDGGWGGTGGVGEILIEGTSGAGAQVIDKTPLVYAHGGSSHFSGTAIESTLPRVPVPGNNYGGGAAGLHQNESSSAFPGADGAAGICIVWEYY